MRIAEVHPWIGDSIWLGAGPWPTRRGQSTNRPTCTDSTFFTGTRALGGLNKIWAQNPKLEGVAGLFGTRCHAGNYFLSEREREIAVCIVASKWHSACPSNAHERRGKGLPTHG
jgi:hypothetical protein